MVCVFRPAASMIWPTSCGRASAAASSSATGMVEVVSSLERDGRPVYRDLRWGVYVVLEGAERLCRRLLQAIWTATDATGRYAAMYKPFHLIGLELSISVLNGGAARRADRCAARWRGDVVAVAKRALKAGEMLDGEGGYTVYGKLVPAARACADGALPIGLAHGVPLRREVPVGATVREQDVTLDEGDPAVRLRRQMVEAFRPAH